MQQTVPLMPQSMLEACQPNLGAATWNTERGLKAALEYQLEGMRFAAKRAYCNLEFMRRLRHCQGWQEVLQLQQAWWSGAAADYAEEWGRIVGTGLAVAKSDVAPLQGTLYRTAADAKARRAA
jgi:hypothetical protein